MSDGPQLLPSGAVTSPKGFIAGAAYAGIKTYAKDKMDVGILMSERPCVTLGLYTQNKFISPSVTLTRSHVDGGRVSAVFASSGIANTGVGEQGLIDAKETVGLAAQHVGLVPEEVAICTTGVIGVELPMALIRSGIPQVQLSKEGGEHFARCIMTTDRRSKSAAVRMDIDGTEVTI
ncbi:MAG: bifunctional ornithine acetyltransferase/N-acetylglutamate synthase, partial [Dehalococcoidia bacterium]